MYDDISAVEAELRRLKPKNPSEFCLARIEMRMRERPAGFLRRWLAWGGCGVVALLAAVLVFSWEKEFVQEEHALTGAVVHPEERGLVRTFSGVEPLEVQQAPDGRFFRHYRMRYLNSTQSDASKAGVSLVKRFRSRKCSLFLWR